MKNKMKRRMDYRLLALAFAMATACSSGGGGEGAGGQSGAGTGGSSATGGTTVSGSGGATATGGETGTGGKGTGGAGSGGAPGTGGRSGSGGGSGTGGSPGSGGTSATGGRGGSGGASGTGGVTASGGTTSGRGGAGGTVASGGTAGGTTGGASGTGGQAGGSGTGGSVDGGVATACASALSPITDYTVLAGPFATTTESKTGPDGQCVIYRPKTLGENGFMHAPIVFGPGIGMQATQLSGLLTSFASHGYVVIGTGVLNGGPNDPANKAAMQNALTWMLQQNDKAGTYQGKLATKCAVSMGYSVGGTSAVEIGGDPAVATVVSIHGHKATAALHGPMLQTSGTADTVGLPMQQYTFDNSKVQTFLGTVQNADHGYIQSNNGGAERPAIIAWMRYWLNGDTGAKSYFYGDKCVMCVSPWTNPQRKNWQ